MHVYLCRWPNGDVAVVHAADPDDAAILLDEIGNADEAELRKLDNFLVSFALEDNGSLQVDYWGTETHEEIFRKAYSRLSAVRARELDKGWDPREVPVPKPIRAAVDRERERLRQGRDKDEKPRARSELGSELQQNMGAPAALINRITERVAEKALRKVKAKGPKH